MRSLFLIGLLVGIIQQLECKVLHQVERVEDLPLFGYNLKDPRLSVKFDLVQNRVLLIQRDNDQQIQLAPESVAFKGNLESQISGRMLKSLDLSNPDIILSDSSDIELTPTPEPDSILNDIQRGSLVPSQSLPLELTNSSASDVSFSSNSSYSGSSSNTGPLLAFEDVFGFDDRTIANTNIFPYRAIGKLASSCDNGQSSCTGSLIGPRTVMTAAHCVQSVMNGQCGDFTFVPGQQKFFLPFEPIKVVDVEVAPLWITDMWNINNDYAVMNLEWDVGYQVGWMGYGYSCSDVFQDLYTAGYPSDLDRDVTTMFQAHCPQTQLNACPCQIYPEGTCLLSGNVFFHQCDTFSGQSGSPLFAYVTPDYPQIRGIHSSGGYNANKAVFINDKIYNFYKNYMEQN